SMERESKGHIHRDASVQLVPRSGLQDVTVNISSGSPEAPALGDGDRIRASRTSTYVGVDRVLSTLDADTRAYTQIAVQELGKALRGRNSELKAGLNALGPALSDTEEVARVLAERRRLLADLVTEMDTIFSTLGRRGRQLREAIHFGRRTVSVTARRDRELAQSVRELPGTLTAVRAALQGVERLAVPLNPALEQLRPTARALPEGLRALRRFVPVGNRLIADLQPLLRDAPRPVANLRSALTALGPASRALTPGLRKLAPTLQPVAEDISDGGASEMFSRVSGVLSTNDALGAVARGAIVAQELPYPENFGLPAGASAAQRRVMGRRIQEALNLTCLVINRFACTPRVRVPGTPGHVPPSELRKRP
ncbi:MAG TPA: hypothetical protein VD931_00415, partial [Baekduia sp.]|nr:hypothetical protein [Baekduia sp.]